VCGRDSSVPFPRARQDRSSIDCSIVKVDRRVGLSRSASISYGLAGADPAERDGDYSQVRPAGPPRRPAFDPLLCDIAAYARLVAAVTEVVTAREYR